MCLRDTWVCGSIQAAIVFVVSFLIKKAISKGGKMDVVNTQLGPEGNLDLKLEGGKVVLTITHQHASGEISLVATEDAKYFLEKLKVLIPGSIDDAIISIAEGALP
jgi:hypothetical protein